MSSNVEVKHTQLFINNEWVNSASGKTFSVINPSTEEVIANVQEGDSADIDAAVKAARKAFDLGSEWRSLNPADRGVLLRKLADLIRRDAEYIIKLTTLNNGKTYTDGAMEIKMSVDTIDYFSGWSDKIFGKTIPTDNSFFTYTRHEPVGVCGQIIPWNYPLALLIWKIAPALACGNTVIVKPSEITPLTALAIAPLIKEAGFPAGVVNIVPGYGSTAGHALSYHMDVNKIAFTGSLLTGRKIQEASAKSNLKRVGLELGGKSPFIIFDLEDADLTKAVTYTANSIFSNQGQTCCASSRIFVHEDVHDRFVAKLKQLAEERVTGSPLDEKTTNGPVISKLQFDKVLDYIKSGKDDGAKCVTGGERIGDKGYFIKPTVFTDVKDEMKIAQEEIFGPVVSILKFKDVNEVIRRANASPFGLAAGVYTNDISKALTVSNALEAGTVWVNCFGAILNTAPFGGYKQSGFGRDLGEYGLHEYTEVKNVTIRL